MEGNSEFQSYQVDYRWRRRALCTISESEKYFKGGLLGNKENTGKGKSLLDYDEPVSTNDIDDPDSLKAHSEEHSANEQFDESLDKDGPIVVPSYLGEDKSDVSDITSPRSDIRGLNTGKRNMKFIGQTKSKEPLNDVIANQKSYEDPEVEKLLDPMLAVELVRKKRDDYSKVRDKRDSGEEKSSELQSTIDKREESNERERSILSGSETVEKHLSPQSSNVKADLLRIRRKARKRSRDKTNKLKQKKKHVSKLSPRSDRSRMSRKSKANKATSEGNSKVETNLVAKKNNGNNFRRRSVKSERSIDSENDSSKLKRSEKKMDDDISRFSLVGRDSIAADGADDSGAATNQNLNGFVATENKQKAFEETEKSMIPPQSAKLRTKRKRHTESSHGFLNKEEELKYYENIREPGTEIDHCSDGDENQLATINEMDPNRAVRSIEEVKKLARQLVTKKKIKTLNDHKLVNIPSKHSFEKKRSVSRRVGKTSPSTLRTIREKTEIKSGRKWGKWTDWSSCSVTCGKGRQIRWRYCLRDCSTAETEMEENPCQLPACPPGKFLGIF
ncbi:hypothetical protein WN51_05529 [Melipona quadrifasciata]|uniref:Uncharacterized protein n=1 Tax=Melipona quadrifasciata TaxID=166423 RepID=A0A0M8ZSZ9_9HYME|nr:hypothetical protein WN51_05529 [Melipona quadrifasciata]